MILGLYGFCIELYLGNEDITASNTPTVIALEQRVTGCITQSVPVNIECCFIVAFVSILSLGTT